MIANPTFDEAGPTPGSAVSWTLRTHVQREAIAGFDAPREHGDDSFELWSTFEGALTDDASRAFFALAGWESFEVGWTLRSFVDALDAAMVVAAIFDASVFETFEWSPLVFDWTAVMVAGAFEDALETDWRNDTFVIRFEDAGPRATSFVEGTSAESFEGAWPTIGRA
jgi:hypothetical protein